MAKPSLRANGSRECAPDDRLREAIHGRNGPNIVIARSVATKQSILSLFARQDGLLRCARNDGKTQIRDPAAQSARVLPVNPALSNQRAQGMPGARCARGRVCDGRKQKAHASVRSHRHHPAFPARWFTAYFVLSPVIGLFCHRRSASNLAKLNASVEASGPHDFAVRLKRPRQKHHPRPPHPASRP
jgi:hypothetical protein